MTNSPSTITAITQQAKHLLCNSTNQFSDFRRIFDGFGEQQACELFNSILEEILLQKVNDKKPAYSDQIHLVATGDFNMTLNIIGHQKEQETTVCASEFDMMVINMLPEAVGVPCYNSSLEPESVYDRPPPLPPLSPRVLEPYVPALFQAYWDIAVLDEADKTAPCLVIYSQPRASVTWVYDRESLEPLTLTDNNLQQARILLAVRVIGELGDQRHIDTLDNLSRSDFDYFVRWEAAESVYKLDERHGLNLLKEPLKKVSRFPFQASQWLKKDQK